MSTEFGSACMCSSNRLKLIAAEMREKMMPVAFLGIIVMIMGECHHGGVWMVMGNRLGRY